MTSIQKQHETANHDNAHSSLSVVYATKIAVGAFKFLFFLSSEKKQINFFRELIGKLSLNILLVTHFVTQSFSKIFQHKSI